MPFLQATPMPLPDLQADVSLPLVLLWAALNPATIAVAFWLGRLADQRAKLGIAAFAGALAGVALLWMAARLRLDIATDVGRAAVGVFVFGLGFGGLWAWIGSRSVNRARR